MTQEPHEPTGLSAVQHTPPPSAGPLDALTDVAGLRVGHAQVSGAGALSGTTVVLAPEGGAIAAVDVRGGGPGTRETDALDPRNLVQRIDAVVLTGGSAYGLDAASGVMAWLEEQGRGVRVGPDPAQVVPVVPAACVFDLGRGGDWRARPDASTGRAAVVDAAGTETGAPVSEGNVGAGTGAVAGQLKGGVGTASVRLASGITVGALVVVNAAGSVIDPRTGVLYGEYGAAEPPVPPAPEVHRAARQRLAEAREADARPPLNTTLAVVATDADLTRAQAQKLAGTAHDGLARAVRPVHLLTDGDTVFSLATGVRSLDPQNPIALNDLLAAGADALTRAIVKAVRAAQSVNGHPGEGSYPAYSDLYGASRSPSRPSPQSRPDLDSPAG
ncbi:P1 family peptidase [Streptomyces sp. NBC_01221]|uniref:P1 family peptidase n=1 Tax=Streptomyces sp. NBC_01221 TaxID=2903782 RepID=UPI002258C971|nr:P1 family peptidase [Streptomyces sp. NBC_01221]MCX4787309.1 P1 family peptidase [Streptomyces sp. NBC_01221]